VICRVDRYTGHLTQDPIVRQGLGPSGIDLECRHVGRPDGGAEDCRGDHGQQGNNAHRTLLFRMSVERAAKRVNAAR